MAGSVPLPDKAPAALRRVARLGSRTLLLNVPASLVQPARRQLLAEPLPGQQELTAGAASVAVRFRTAAQAEDARAHLAALPFDAGAVPDGPLLSIDTVYDGEDLAEVARLTGLDIAAVIGAHSEQEWRVAFVGFAPGFAYLKGQDERLQVPRRSTPRVRIPAGSVALAGPFSAVYPRSSPGGWQLIGHTSAELWSLDARPPTRLEPGTRVRFRAVRERVEPAEPAPAHLPARTPDSSGLLVRLPGVQSLIEDAGRAGFSAWGVSRSGAADTGSLAQANRLVGNDSGAAAIENTAGGLELEAVGDQVLAVTGSDAHATLCDDRGEREVAAGTPFALRSGERLRLGPPRAGLRSYVAIRGGIDAPVVLGSRSTDTLAGLGVPALAVGDLLPVGAAPRSAVGAPEPVVPPVGPQQAQLDVLLGPDDDWFGTAAIAAFQDQEWTVTAQSNRVGLRLEGVPLKRERSGELASQGLVPGAIQVPPSGQPVLFGADHPATGGYPVIGVVADHHLDRAAQVPIGARIRFRIIA
ncbi:5-oxoprolinase/urea amidolyase family protein [Micropruina sp.]|uniref:5-oxoprolinase subunit B/C family protein n=1 Tax=Micropruina sp. TaxID=2737536 RepID=UPI0039E23DC3